MPDSQNGESSDLNAGSDVDWDSDLPTWWKEHYRDKLTSSQVSPQDLLVDLIHEFMVPLTTIRGYAELIRDQVPPGQPVILPTGEARTSKDFAEVILKYARRQQLMFRFVAAEVWENLPNDEPNS